MTIRLLFFGRLTDAFPEEIPAFAVDEGTRIRDLRARLAEIRPDQAPVLGSAMFARNDAYAPDESVLAPGDAVAVIPPVSGGREGAPSGDGGR